MSTSEQSERRRPHNAPPGTDYWAARERLREERIVVKTEGTTTVAYQDKALVLKESADAFTQAVAPEEQLAAAAQRRLQGLSSRSGAPGTCCLHLLPAPRVTSSVSRPLLIGPAVPNRRPTTPTVTPTK
ncbi:hypothetical protein [Streptomyces griseus]|uniref:hypothetical protein n=1 Tax=Streptomyces griseus TaxID=1911 RepID=UPI00131B3CB5|nr:hypothetical protein [Streptomyces griseus]